MTGVNVTTAELPTANGWVTGGSAQFRYAVGGAALIEDIARWSPPHALEAGRPAT